MHHYWLKRQVQSLSCVLVLTTQVSQDTELHSGSHNMGPQYTAGLVITQGRLQGACRFKQRGKAAEEADNVFHHLTYEGAVDVENMADKQQRAALESQINEFGQCPR